MNGWISESASDQASYLSECLQMFRHPLQAAADHLTEADICRQIAFGEGAEARDQHPFRLSAARLERDRIDGWGRGGIAGGVLGCSPHEPFRFDDLFEEAVDRDPHSVGRLHHMMPGSAGPQVHLADEVGEARSAVPLSDVFWIGDSGPDQCTRRIEYARKNDHGVILQTHVYSRRRGEIASWSRVFDRMLTKPNLLGPRSFASV
jgi:hypothetical protein